MENKFLRVFDSIDSAMYWMMSNLIVPVLVMAALVVIFWLVGGFDYLQGRYEFFIDYHRNK